MSFTFRPARRENTPLIIGIAGPTKSGKTYSAHRLAQGLAQGGTVAMINAEGAKGHQYADKFPYVAADIEAPFRPERYTEALKAALALDPAVVIIDSGSHMHDGPGGILEYHEDELDRMAGNDFAKRQRVTYSAWIRPKAAENEFIYTMLGADCHIILCFRAKEKIKVVPGKQPVDLGWQPIAGERVAFETIFTLTLPPNSKGVPDLAISAMREPFDSMIPAGLPLNEGTGLELAAWAAGGKNPAAIEPRPVGGQENHGDVAGVATGAGQNANPAADVQVGAAEKPSPAITEKQSGNLDRLVGTLRKSGHITNEQLWQTLRPEQDWPRDDDGELHWSPLRDSLTKDEASALIDRLERYADNLATA